MPQKRFRDRKNRDKDNNNKENNTNAEGGYVSFNNNIVREQIDNAIFKQYYMDNIVPADQWDEMTATMKTLLPTSFRISNINGPQDAIQDTLHGDCFGIPEEPTDAVDEEGNKLSLRRPQVLPWYRPKGNAYQINIGKKDLKQFKQLQTFREFLMEQDAAGNITRQEAVSMIPPLLLDVKPHHVVLDMCAAPGSKTSQLLEALHLGLADGEVPSGMCIANDANPQRANLLVHQLKRLGSPAFLVTNHEGQIFPALTTTDQLNGTNNEPTPIQFDRILCDAPCGGDGTMRKTPTVWANWSLHNSYALQPLQLQIAYRGLQLLKEDGLMVYSTCSINPLEDEAVVMELIRRGGGNLELVSIPDILPELKHSPGQTDWKNFVEVPKSHENPDGPKLIEVFSLEDILALPPTTRNKLLPTSFSPKFCQELIKQAKVHAAKEVAAWKLHAEVFYQEKTRSEVLEILANKPNYTKPAWDQRGKKIKQPRTGHIPYVVDPFVQRLLRVKDMSIPQGIEKTVRVLPHQQDTGGFFIALIKKTGPIPNVEDFGVPLPYTYNLQYTDYCATVYNPKLHDQLAVDNSLAHLSRVMKRNGQKFGEKVIINNEDYAYEDEDEEDPVVVADDESKKDQEQTVTENVGTTTENNNRTHKQQSQAGHFKPRFDDFAVTSAETKKCIQEVYGIKQELPLLTRSTNRQYLVSPALYNLLLTPANRLVVVHGGLKAFELEPKMGTSYNTDMSTSKVTASIDTNHYHRVCQDGIAFIRPHMTRQLIKINKQDAIALLSHKKADQSTAISQLSSEVQKQWFSNPEETDFDKVIRSGSLCFTYQDGDKKSYNLAAFKRGLVFHTQVDQNDRQAILSSLGYKPEAPVVSAVPGSEDPGAQDLVQLDPLPATNQETAEEKEQQQ